jgi:Transglutaminase-like superfamily
MMMNLETRAPMQALSMEIPEGDPGTAATIEQMRRLIDHGMKDPIVHELAADIIKSAGVRAFDWTGEARAVYNWVRANIRFTRDVRGKETLHAAREIIRLGIGDCDDFTILICALMSTVGAKCSIITISSDPRIPETFSHVYPEVSINGRWVTMDAARRDPAFGKAPDRFYRKRRWDATSSDYQDIAGLGSTAPQTSTPRLRFRNKRAFMHGMGRGLRGMGDDATDAAALIQAASVGTANIIAADRASPYNLVPTTALGPTGSALPAVSSTSFMGIGLGTWLVVLLGVGAVAVMGGKR